MPLYFLDLTSLLIPASHPKELGSPKRRPVKFKPLSTSAAHETGLLSAPMDVVVQFGLRTIESSRMTSSTVLPKLPADTSKLIDPEARSCLLSQETLKIKVS